MNSIKFIVVVSIALLTVELINHQVVNGYLPLEPSIYRESIFIVNYCREHASDSVNPVQDLVDKTIITWGWFNGETCATVKLFHDTFLTNYMGKIKPKCYDSAKERLGHEPDELTVNMCIGAVLESENIK